MAKNLPTIKEVATYAAIAGAGLLLWKLFGPKKNEGDKTVKQAEDEAKKMQAAGIRPTYSTTQYRNFADVCYEGMKFAWISDNYGAVEDVLKKMYNSLDVLLLIQAYGTRQEYNFGVPVGDPKTLFAQVRDDLSSSRIESINKVWISRNISFRL